MVVYVVVFLRNKSVDLFSELKHNGMSSIKIQEAKNELIYTERWVNNQVYAQLFCIKLLLL